MKEQKRAEKRLEKDARRQQRKLESQTGANREPDELTPAEPEPSAPVAEE